MQIRTVQNGFEAFESNSKHSNSNCNHSKGIQSIQMQTRNIRMGFEAFKCKFEPFERDWKRSNANANHSKVIRNIQMQIHLNWSKRPK